MKTYYFLKSCLKKWLNYSLPNAKGKLQILKQIRFKIGKQYENYEQYLEGSKTIIKNGLEFEIYTYLKDDFKSLFGTNFNNKIQLYFNADILCGVKFYFKGNRVKEIKYELAQYINQQFIPDNKGNLVIMLDDDIILIIKYKEEYTHLYLSSHYFYNSLFYT